MNYRTITTMLAMVVLTSASAIHAESVEMREWVNTSPAAHWFDAANWNPAGTPAASEALTIALNFPSPTTIASDQTVWVDQGGKIYLPHAGQGVLLNFKNLLVGQGEINLAGSTSKLYGGIVMLGYGINKSATVNLSGGATLEYGDLFVGQGGSATLNISGAAATGYTGRVGDSGVNSTATVNVTGPNAYWNNAITLISGDEDTQGTLNILAGGQVANASGLLGGALYNSSTKITTYAGVVTVDGAGSRWDNTEDLDVRSRLIVQNGGAVSSTLATVEDYAYVTLDGPDSLWENSMLAIDPSGMSWTKPRIDILNGGGLTADTMEISNVPKVASGTRMSYLSDAPRITVSGEGSSLVIADTLQIGNENDFEGLSANALGGDRRGTIRVDVSEGGQINVGQELIVYRRNMYHILNSLGNNRTDPWNELSPELLADNGGKVLVGTPTEAVDAGTLRLFPNGTLTSDAVLLANVVNGGTMNVARGYEEAMTVMGRYEQLEEGTLNLTLAGAGGFDRPILTIQGLAMLEGTLKIDFDRRGGFLPNIGDTFVLLNSHGILGEFETVEVPEFVQYELIYGETIVLLELTAWVRPELGDFNGDGATDLADYTIWADAYGQAGEKLPADANFDGMVDLADYTVWADGFASNSAMTAE